MKTMVMVNSFNGNLGKKTGRRMATFLLIGSIVDEEKLPFHPLDGLLFDMYCTYIYVVSCNSFRSLVSISHFPGWARPNQTKTERVSPATQKVSVHEKSFIPIYAMHHIYSFLMIYPSHPPFSPNHPYQSPDHFIPSHV